MQYKVFFLFFITISCTANFNDNNVKQPFNSKGFAYIYHESDYLNKIIKKKMNNNLPQIAHNKIRPGSLIQLINPKTNDSIILKNNKKLEYPDFYKILITKPVANKLNLNEDFPYIEISEIKRNKSFIAQKSKIYVEEKKIHSNAPVESVKIDNISIIKKNIKKINKDKIFIVVAEFYSKESANLLKNRIINELTNYNSKKLNIKIKNTNKITLLSGPYSSINSMKNDYIQLKNFGFEELDISINE